MILIPSFFPNGGFLYFWTMLFKIVSLRYPVDNWGTEHTTENPVEILEALREQDSDDDCFTDESGNHFFIDDLIGKEVQVGDITITV